MKITPTKPPIARKLKIKAHTPNDHFTLRSPSKMKTSAATLLPNSKQKITKSSQASGVTLPPSNIKSNYLAPAIKHTVGLSDHAIKNRAPSIERIQSRA